MQVTVVYPVTFDAEGNKKASEIIKKVREGDDSQIELLRDIILDMADNFLLTGSVKPLIHNAELFQLID